MSNALALHEVFSRPTYRADYAKAKARQICIICGRAAVNFRDSSARFEYTVSALCQECQDRLFYSRERGKEHEGKMYFMRTGTQPGSLGFLRYDPFRGGI